MRDRRSRFGAAIVFFIEILDFSKKKLLGKKNVRLEVVNKLYTLTQSPCIYSYLFSDFAELTWNSSIDFNGSVQLVSDSRRKFGPGIPVSSNGQFDFSPELIFKWSYFIWHA